jgi:hypothetical protein
VLARQPQVSEGIFLFEHSDALALSSSTGVRGRDMQQSPPAGWYHDPEYQGYRRYWNGQQWTDDRAILRPAAAWTHVPETKGLPGYKMVNTLWLTSQVVNAIVLTVFAVALVALIVWIS